MPLPTSNPLAERRLSLRHIACLQDCYRPEGTWTGGPQKAATICRKVAEVEDGGTIEVWGDGSAIGSYTYVDDLVAGIYLLMRSDLEGPVNIGCPQYVTVTELVDTVAQVTGMRVQIRHVDGPARAHARNFSNARSYSTRRRAQVYLKEGIRRTSPWIAGRAAKAGMHG